MIDYRGFDAEILIALAQALILAPNYRTQIISAINPGLVAIANDGTPPQNPNFRTPTIGWVHTITTISETGCGSGDC